MLLRAAEELAPSMPDLRIVIVGGETSAMGRPGTESFVAEMRRFADDDR